MYWIFICAAFSIAAANISLNVHNQHVPDRDAARIKLRQEEHFHFQINCVSIAKLYAIDPKTGNAVQWLNVSKNGKTVFGYADKSVTGIQKVCFGYKSFVCTCITINVTKDVHSRQRRDIFDVEFSVQCGTSRKITEGVLLLNTDYNKLSDSQKTGIVSNVSTYVSVEKRNILILENRGSFYKTKLENPKFVSFGLGDSTGANTNTTVIKFLASCGELASTDGRIVKFKADSQTGELSRHLGYPLISWYFITGTLIPLTTTSVPSTTSPSDPESPKVKGPIDIVVSNKTFILKYGIPDDTFYDREDGGTANLSLYLYQSSGQELPKSSWIMLLSTNVLFLYSANIFYEVQPKDGYAYRLSAIDSSGREVHTSLNVKFAGPLYDPNYVRTLVVTSSSSVVVTSYYDIYILDLLHSKMSPYLNIRSRDFFNLQFNVTRLGYTMLSLRYSFSSRDFIQDSCNVTAINNIRLKLNSLTGEQEFRKVLKPQFDLKSIEGESFESYCSGLSNRPPIIGSLIGNFEIIVGKYFTFNILSSTFVPPTGSKMNLTLELRFGNNSKIPSNFWIGLSSSRLDEKSSLQGIVTTRIAQRLTSISIKVVAMTPLLSESSQTVQLNMQRSATTATFYVVMTQITTSSIPLTTFAPSFIRFMSSFLAMSYSSFFILDYVVSSNVVVVQWTILFASSECNMSKVRTINRSLLASNGSINKNLVDGLVQSLNFRPSKAEFKLAGSCDIPTVAMKIPELIIPKYDILSYEVPVNAFSDQTDSNLHIMLLLDNGGALPENSWIWYNNKTRRISGFPFVLVNGTYSYILRATDVDGHYVDQNISILLNWMQPTYNFFYHLKFSYSPSLLPLSNVITTFIRSVKIYFKQIDVKNFIIFRPLFLANNRISLYFQNTSLSSDNCDVAGNNYILEKIQDPADSAKPSQEFINFMGPNFLIDYVMAGENPSCSKANRKPPYFNSGNVSITKFYRRTKVVHYCSIFTLLIPASTFIDKEEGDTRNLKLTLRNEDDTALSLSNWVTLNASSQTIIAVPTDEIYFLQSRGFMQYNLVATDSDGKSSSTLIKFNVTGPPPSAYYNVTMVFNVSMEMNYPHVFQIDSLLKSMQEILTHGPKIHIRSYDMQRITDNRFLATLIWSPCHTTEGVCDVSAIEKIRSRLFSAGSNDMKSNLQSAFDTRFRVFSLTESRNGPCSEDPPYVKSPVPRLHVTFCEPFLYQIPENTFADKQDGNTRKLMLKLLNHDGSAILNNFWIQFDSTKQQITAILTKEQNVTSYPKSNVFILTATDTSNLSTNMTIEVTISDILPPYSHAFTIVTVYSLPVSSHVLYQFAKKITDYLGGKLGVISRTEAQGQNLVVSWSNCSLRYNPCDVLGAKYIRDRLQASDGTISNQFRKIMEPEFKQIFLKEVKSGPCQEDVPPILSVPFGPLTVTVCETYIAKIPENTFTDREQGNARSLSLKVKNHPYYWIHFDTKQQELKILLTTEIAKEITFDHVTITLTATDLFLHEAEQRIIINLNRSRLFPNHRVSMQFMITSLGNYGDFVSIYDAMRKRIVAFFQRNAALSSLQYESLSSQVQINSVLTAEWSSCSLPQDKCEISQLNYIQSLISSNNDSISGFSQALLPEFKIMSVNTTFHALCKDEMSTPIIQNPLAIINITFCGYQIYEIPANTFYDKIDGNTRNLTLTIINGSGQAATEPWFDFDSVHQSIRILLSGKSFPKVMFPSIFTYKLKATTKRGTSAFDDLKFRISSPHPNISFAFQINFVWPQVDLPSNLAVVITTMNRISAYLKRTPDDFHVVSKEASSVSNGNYFVISIGNCSTHYDPCDRGMLLLYSQKIHDVTGVKESFKQALGSEIVNIQTKVITYGPCMAYNTPPQVVNPLSKLQVSLCSDFNYTIPASTFYDKEQSSLRLSVTEIDGMPANGTYRWVSIDPTFNVLYGFISDAILINKPAMGYNLTIRATDDGRLFTETHLILDISGPAPQKLYQFTMTLRPSTSRSSVLLDQVSILRLLNSYFKAQFAHLISAALYSDVITARYSICPLPNRCDESLAYYYFSKIVTSTNIVQPKFAAYFAHKFTITTASVFRNLSCQATINAPIPSRLTWEVTASYCSGFRYHVPADMFYDKEDGNTRNLELSLLINATHHISYSYWVQLNKTTQEIYGYPTREISLGSPTNVLLIAKDSTGQKASVSVRIAFTSHPEPKYIYRIAFQKASAATSLDDIAMFSSKLRTFLNDNQNTSFGLIRYSHSTGNTYHIDYANCSVTYDPCDFYALSSVRNRLFRSDQFPTIAFKTAMYPINVSYGQVEVSTPCFGNLSHPPTVRSQIEVLNIPVWSMFAYQIPANTFYDTEDGNTRNLALLLTVKESNAMITKSWLNMNSTTQTITGFGYASFALIQPPSGFTFSLVAVDSSNLSAVESFHAKIYGPAQLLKDCQIQMLINTSSGSKVNNDIIMDILKRLAAYFSLRLDNIGLVDFIRHDLSNFTFSWSYVSNAYHAMTPSSPFLPSQIDYKGLVTDVLTKLFLSDRKTVKPAFYSAFVDVSIISVKTVFSGVCQNIPPLALTASSFGLSIPFAGYRKEAIHPGWFYDFEEGNAFNMKLHLLTANNSTVPVESWANIDSYSKLLLFSMRDSQRYSSQVRFTYYLKAIDAGGRGAVVSIFAEKASNSSRISPMKITFEFIVASFQISEIFVNQSIFISDATAQLYALGSGLNIITNNYNSQYGPSMSRSFTWQPNVYQDCSSSEVFRRTKEAIQPNSLRFKQFKLPFLPQFNLQRVYFSSSCEAPGMAPLPSSGTLELNVTMCSPLVYKLPLKTFVDSVDGNILSMRIRLLGEDRRELSSNSWILLNSATLQLYAIYHESILMSKISSNSPTPVVSQRFTLEATNSRGLKSYKSVKIAVLAYPYTSDCYATINVQRMFGPSEMPRLDVLYRLIISISNYYNDAHIQLKIHKFVKKSPNLSYQLTFSNCSFVFDTMMRAKGGLDESYRTKIASIFSQMVHDNGTIKTAFKSFMYSSGFNLQNVNVSYSCIEAPPYSEIASLIRYAYFTLSFNDILPYNIFADARDGFSLALSLRYVNGTEVSPDEWLQINQMTRTIYGSVTVMQSYVSTNKYLLVATDSSYRTANISYTVRIANSVPNYNVTFNLGFTSTFSRFSITAHVLRNFTMKIAKYLGNESDGSNIVIERYQSFSSISWVFSQLNCNPLSVAGVVAKLQKTAYKPMPSDALKTALGPEFSAQAVIVDGPKCLEPNAVQIIANSEVNINSSLCGYMQYQIPDNVFRSSLGETARELLLTLKPTTGSGPSIGSVVQFSKAFKYFGIVAVNSRLSHSLTYRLEARSPRSSTASAFTFVRVNFSGYQQVNAVQHEMCILTVNVTTRYNPSISENEMLQKLIEKLAKYLGTSHNQIQIMSYKRFWIYPVKLTIQFTQCGWAKMIQSSESSSLYFNQLNKITEKLFHAGDAGTKSPKREFLDSLKPDFNIESVERNETTCKIPPNRPPVGKKLGLVLVPSCGEFNYQVPADLFADEDGNTRKLGTQLHQSDGTELAYDSWVVYDNKTQTMSGLPTDEILSKQPSEGYQYRIVATDMQDLSSFVQFKIKIDGVSHALSTGTLMNLSFESAIEQKFKTNTILAFTRKLSSYKVIKDPQNRFRIKSAIVTASNITISVANCTPCSVEAAVKYYDISRRQSDLQNHMSPEFPVLYSVKADGSCSPSDDSYNNIVNGSTQNVTFCKRTRINLLMLTGIVQLPPDTKFIITQMNMKIVPQHSWFWLNETSSVIEVFPSETIWKQEKENGTQYLLSIATISTNTRLSSFLLNRLHIFGIPPRSGFPYTITFSSKFSSNQADAFYINLIYDQLVLYFGREDLQHVFLNRTTGKLFTWNFFICGLPFNCTDPDVVSLNKKIYKQSKELRSEFKAAFTHGISILSMNNNCTNNPPEILKPNLNLSVPFCGLYRYQIPNDFAMDKEDGDARGLMILLRAKDGGFLPRDSWIRLNETSHELYAFPLEGLSKVPQLSGWDFLLIVRDNDGGQVQTGLKIFVQQGQTPSYSLNFTFDTVNQLNEMSFLDIQVNFLSLVSSLFFDSSLHHYKVLSFHKITTSGVTSETFKIRFSNCSVMEYICRKAETQLFAVQERMMSSSVENSSLFNRFIEHNFRIKDVKNESHYFIDKKPIVLNVFDTIRLKSCDRVVREIPNSVFYDAEVAELGNLTKRLVFDNSSYIPSDYWVQMLHEQIYVVPYGYTESGTYNFRLVATDMCGQSVSTPVSVILTNEPRAVGLEISMIGTIEYIETKPNAFYVAQIQEKIRKGLEGSIHRVRITSFERENDVFKVKWQKCVATCDRNTSNELKRMVYQNVAFRDSFLPTFSIKNITDNGLDNCFEHLVTIHNISVTAGICEKLNFNIPRNIFPNITDETLKLQLLNNSKLSVNKREWLQYNESKQFIYGYPRIPDQNNMQRIYNYYLMATDMERNTKLITLTVEVAGKNPIVTQMFTISGETEMGQETPLILQEVTLINKIGSFFGNSQIKNMKYNRNGVNFNFSWSFCNMTSDVCDCHRIRSIRENTKNVDAFRLYMQPEFNIKSNIEETMLGICEKEQIPLVSENQTDIVVLPGKYFSMEISERKFHDFEDGYTRNLTLYLASTDNVKFNNSWWIKIQNYELCGLITLYESLQINLRKSVYKTVAQDRCGNEAVDSYNVTVLEKVPKLSYKVSVYLNGSFGVNCTKTSIFTKRISNYIGMPEIKIYIYNYTNYYDKEHTSVVTWGVTNITERNCTNGTIRELTEKFVLSNGSVNAVFIKYMEPEHLVINVTDDDSQLCVLAAVMLPLNDDNFPWWLIIIIIIIAAVLLLLWCIWLIIPRCCWSCCAKGCSCCAACCIPGGKYASLEEPLIEEGTLAKTAEDDVQANVASIQNQDTDDPIDKNDGKRPLEAFAEEIDIAPLVESTVEFPESSSFSLLPKAEDFDDSNFGSMAVSKETSSGFSEELASEEELKMEQNNILFAEAAPAVLPDTSLSLHRTSVPPLYNFDSRDQFNFEELDFQNGTISSKSHGEEGLQEKKNQFNEINSTPERMNQSPPYEEDRAVRVLPQPSIQYSDARRPSQVAVTATQYEDESELHSEVFENHNGNSQPLGNQFGSELEGRLSLPTPLMSATPDRRHGPVRRYSISQLGANRNPEVDNEGISLRRSSNISYVNRASEGDQLLSLRHYSPSRRTLSDGNLLSHQQNDHYFYKRRQPRISLDGDDRYRHQMSRKVPRSLFIIDQDGIGRKIVNQSDKNQNGISRKASTAESRGGQVYSLMEPLDQYGDGEFHNMALGPASFDARQEETNKMKRRSVFDDDGFTQSKQRMRYNSELYDSRLLQNGRREMAASIKSRKSSYVSDLGEESDSGISDYGFNLPSMTNQDNMSDERVYGRRRSRQAAAEPRRRSRSSGRINPLKESTANMTRNGYFEMEPRRMSRMYLNNTFMDDSIV